MKRTEKSTQKAIRVRCPITVIADKTIIEGVTRNITDTGMLILSREPLQIDRRYQITVRLPDYPDRRLTCRVVWSNLYGIDPMNRVYGMGYCFMQASGKDRIFLTDVVSDYPRN